MTTKRACIESILPQDCFLRQSNPDSAGGRSLVTARESKVGRQAALTDATSALISFRCIASALWTTEETLKGLG